MGVAKFVAALTLGALALIAVTYISDDSSVTMFEEVAKELELEDEEKPKEEVEA